MKKVWIENVVIFLLLPLFLFFLFISPALSKNGSSALMNLFLTARIDIKNFGLAGNSVKVIQNGKKNAQITTPKWFNDGKGQGTQIEIPDNQAGFLITCSGDGELTISIKGLDRRDNQNKRYPLWIDYTKCTVNGKNILPKECVAAWHDKPFKYSLPVKNGDNIQLHLEWKPYLYDDNELERVVSLALNIDKDKAQKKAKAVKAKIVKMRK